MIRIRVHELENKGAVVKVQGRLVLGDATRRFRIVTEHLFANSYRTIKIDFAEIHKIDCAGLGELVQVHAMARQLNVRIELLNLSGRIIDLLVMTKLVTLFPPKEDVTLFLAA